MAEMSSILWPEATDRMKPVEGMETLLDRLTKTRTNEDFLSLFDPK